MNLGNRGEKLIKKFETLKLKAYHGAADPDGLYTIGWGHTGPEVGDGMKISEKDANTLFFQDVQSAEQTVDEACNMAATTQAQFDAMVSLTFNIGVNAFRKSTVLRMHNSQNYFEAAQAFLMWVKSAGESRRGLLRRRIDEAQLYASERFK